MKKTIVFAFLIALCTISFSAHSMVGLNLKEIKPLTQVEYIPDEEFNKATDLVEETPYVLYQIYT